MSTATQAIFAAWSPPFWLTIAVLAVSAIYIRGWVAIRRTRPAYFTFTRMLFFLSGMAVLWLAIASPIDGFADALLSAHMVQHFLLMSAVPPLVLLGAPVVPLLRGLPRWIVKSVVGPLIATRWLRSLGQFFIAPLVAWLTFNLVFLAWHLPAAYDLALRDEHIHDFEHLCFLGTAILFWWVIIRPWPSQSRSTGWMVLLYLLSADIVNTALSAFLAFCNHPIYQFYVAQPNPFHISALSDQVAGGVIMWVLNSTVFLVPAMWLTFRLAGFVPTPLHKKSPITAGTLPV
ncbi:MAG TPA: cytochrome c oxidase assembly protein [Acidobacteriaceae bacterium]|nr:cytochrome c oxidase assembly protein [Acidobacteriaceae bacterium]